MAKMPQDVGGQARIFDVRTFFKNITHASLSSALENIARVFINIKQSNRHPLLSSHSLLFLVKRAFPNHDAEISPLLASLARGNFVFQVGIKWFISIWYVFEF